MSVTGATGSGKTQAVLHAAARLRDRKVTAGAVVCAKQSEMTLRCFLCSMRPSKNHSSASLPERQASAPRRGGPHAASLLCAQFLHITCGGAHSLPRSERDALGAPENLRHLDISALLADESLGGASTGDADASAPTSSGGIDAPDQSGGIDMYDVVAIDDAEQLAPESLRRICRFLDALHARRAAAGLPLEVALAVLGNPQAPGGSLRFCGVEEARSALDAASASAAARLWAPPLHFAESLSLTGAQTPSRNRASTEHLPPDIFSRVVRFSRVRLMEIPLPQGTWLRFSKHTCSIRRASPLLSWRRPGALGVRRNRTTTPCCAAARPLAQTCTPGDADRHSLSLPPKTQIVSMSSARDVPRTLPSPATRWRSSLLLCYPPRGAAAAAAEQAVTQRRQQRTGCCSREMCSFSSTAARRPRRGRVPRQKAAQGEEAFQLLGAPPQQR